jgi:MtN3 and saliva related transmembrane protein
MDDLFTFIGYVAGTLTTLAFLPQVFHIHRLKSAGELSWKMLIAFSIGLLLWFVYGLYLHSWPMILANGICLCLQFLIIGMKVRYQK